jgi:hypothetical protein
MLLYISVAFFQVGPLGSKYQKLRPQNLEKFGPITLTTPPPGTAPAARARALPWGKHYENSAPYDFYAVATALFPTAAATVRAAFIGCRIAFSLQVRDITHQFGLG